MSPFKALYGRDPPKLIRYEFDASDAPALQEILLDKDKLMDKLKNNLCKAQQYMKEHNDVRKRQWELEVGDLVLLKLQPYQ